MNVNNFVKKLNIKNPKIGKTTFNLFTFQEQLLDVLDGKDNIVLLKSRQMGVTELLAAYALYTAITRPESNIWYFSRNHRSDSLFIKRLLYSFANMEEKYGAVELINSSIHTLEFSNGSSIDARNSSNMVHRAAADLVIMDEAAWIDNFSNLIAGIIPRAYNGKILIASTPSYFDTEFYSFWQTLTPILGQKSNFKQIQLPWHLHSNRDAEWLKYIKTALSPEKFDMEYNCKFIKRPE